ncbi:hypothetical protein [Yoonia sp.]|uniref:hypothetical protein n=1 Tax=Yoonia sp. TaxID=2212373 RepID=UPI00404825EC
MPPFCGRSQKDDQLHFCSCHQHGTPDGHGCISPQNTSPHPPLISFRRQIAEFYSATVRSSDRFCGHFVSGIHNPDWDRFSFSPATARLLPRHRQLREYWSALGIEVTSLRHLEYCERYILVRDDATAELQYYYNGKNLLRRFGPTPGTRSVKRLLAEALSAFDALEDTGELEAPDEFVADFLERLDASLEWSEIRRTSFKLMPYRLRVSFADDSRRGDIDFTFDGSKTWTAAQEVGGQGASGGLYSEIQRSINRWKN